MVARPSVVVLLLGVAASLGASYRTTNFVVYAQTGAIAQQVGKYAEHYRRTKAREWLGQEMPRWGQPCPLRVTVQMSGSGGATSFVFDRGSILKQDMRIEGSLDRLLASVLPHEVTHTVFAHYFRQPVPRWADEGGSVLSEDDRERRRHDHMIRQFLRQGRAMPLRRLFTLKNYPPDVMVLYAQGYSVTRFLVERSNRARFLAFVAHGMRAGWDSAARTHYRFRSVEELEQAWIRNLRNPRSDSPSGLLARGPRRSEVPAQRVVRQTFPPAQPLLQAPRPIYRGQAPEEEEPAPRPRRSYPSSPSRSRPDSHGRAPSASPTPWLPARPSPAPVRLLPPRPVGTAREW